MRLETIADRPLPFPLTKLQPPQPRVALIERERLETALATALRSNRLTLLQAPAGYGKTAALTRQIARWPADWPLAWVSADDDDDLARLLTCVTAALEPFDLPWRVAPEALATLAQGEGGARTAALQLVNALAAGSADRGLLVIDDLHRIADPQVNEWLMALIERLPPNWGLALATRSEPRLPLARWRVAGECSDFGIDELRFDTTEALRLLQQQGGAQAVDLGVTSAATARLVERTGGWPAALRLSLRAGAQALGSLAQGELPPITQRHLFDYLASEVLDAMDVDLREFLLRCSVLPELTVARCRQVSGRTDSARLLARVERIGLLVSVLDTEPITLRLHELFRDFLEHCLQREHPDEIVPLLRRAADCEPDLARAVGLLARAGAWDEAGRRLVDGAPRLLTDGDARAVTRLLALIPRQHWAGQPELHELQGLCVFTQFDFDALRAAMQDACDGYVQAGRHGDAVRARVYLASALRNSGHGEDAGRMMSALRAEPLGDADRALVSFFALWDAYAAQDGTGLFEQCTVMLQALERQRSLDLWSRCFVMLGLMAGMPGMLPLLRRFDDGASALIGEQPVPLRAGLWHARAWRAIARGRLDDAVQALAQADADVRWLGSPHHLLVDNLMSHILIDALRGDAEGARQAMRLGVDDIARTSASNRLCHGHEYHFSAVRAAWILGDEAWLRTAAEQLMEAANPCEWTFVPLQRRMTQALLAWISGRHDAAEDLLRPLASLDEFSCHFPASQALLLLADWRRQGGRLDEAAALLRPWLAQAHAGGSVGGALMAGPRVLQGLSSAVWGGRLAAADAALLRSLRDAFAHVGSAAPAPAGAVAPAGKLTEREFEVLQRLSAGDSNKLIARTLSLSPHTVK
ncbi:MAG: tetratricopeptide repeat protein, partial [Lautropia sp.]